MKDIYDRLGVSKLINARGAATAFGGSLMPAESLGSIVEAGAAFVSINELLDKACAHLAQLLKVDEVFISSGAAAGLTLSAAGCLTGLCKRKIADLPTTDGWRNEIIVQRTHRPNYVHQGMRSVGAKVVEVGSTDRVSLEDILCALSERTAGVQVQLGEARQPRVAEVAAILDGKQIPLIVDAASEVPPRRNLSYALSAGANLLVVSGGKGIRGPQSTGLVLGDAHLVRACRANASPNNAIGRGMKVSKEDICGLVVAVEKLLERDEDADMREYLDRANYIAGMLKSCSRIRLEIRSANPISRPEIPRLFLWFDRADTKLLAQVKQQMLAGEKPIVIGDSEDELYIDFLMLKADEVDLVASKLLNVLATLT